LARQLSQLWMRVGGWVVDRQAEAARFSWSLKLFRGRHKTRDKGSVHRYWNKFLTGDKCFKTEETLWISREARGCVVLSVGDGIWARTGRTRLSTQQSARVCFCLLYTLASYIIYKKIYAAIKIEEPLMICPNSILVQATEHGYFVASWWRTPLRHPPKVTIDQ
jgi:hypothetical protein